MSRTRIGLFGIIGDDNLGNDASLDIVVHRLRRLFPEVTLGFMGMGPAKLERQYGAPARHLQWFEAHQTRLPPPAKVWKALGRGFDVVRVARWVSGYDAVIVPGGFSYGDYLRAGALARFSPVMESLKKFAARGGYVFGICNGFQILCES